MLLKHKKSGSLVEVLGFPDLINPNHLDIVGRYNAGEDLPDPEKFPKSELIFPSGEKLPNCWIDVHYRDALVHRG